MDVARKYTRDNRGRFAPAGTGATARGGRLRTAAGNKRQTRTMQGPAGRKGTISKPRGLKPGAVNVQRKRGAATSALRPGELMNANARPVNTMAKPRKTPDVFKKTKRENLAIASEMIGKAGMQSYIDTRRKRANGTAVEGVASWSAFRPNKVTLVKNSEWWSNPKKYSREQRRRGEWSTSDPAAVVYHEIGHSRSRRTGHISDPTKPWGIGVRPFSNERNQRLARRVSKYGATSPSEFVAETYAGLKTGRKYDYQVMRAYREEAGFSARPAARRRSRVRRKP